MSPSNKGIDAQTVQALYDKLGSQRAVARELGLHHKTVGWHLSRMEKTSGGIVDVPEAVDQERSVDEIRADRIREWERTKAASEDRMLTPVKVNIDGPIGIAHMGDWHIDDPGCNLPKIEEHMRIVRETPGMIGANVGDYQNNWVGRLAAKYADQTITAVETWKLLEYLLAQCEWLYLVGGNHDAWTGAGDPMRWIARQVGARLQYWAVRFALQFPNKREVRVNSRHDFRGHSQYNTAHGPTKAALMGWHDHILTAGHKHVSGYNVVKWWDRDNWDIAHCLRVAGYKTHDDYANQSGFRDASIFECAVTVIDPAATHPARLVTTFFNVEEGADYLTWKRKNCA